MKKIKLVFLILIFTYLCLPFFAGIANIGGDRRGPRMFFRGHHEILYILGYQLVRGAKPIVPFGKERALWYKLDWDTIATEGAPSPRIPDADEYYETTHEKAGQKPGTND